MKGLSKSLRALDAHLREQNRKASREQPIGTGPYLKHCDECHRPFNTEDRHAVLCPPCDEKESAEVTESYKDRDPSYEFRRVGRGRYRD